MKYIIITAAGSGTRMESKIPKQFINLDKIPILMRTIEQFHSTVKDCTIIITLPGDEIDTWLKLCKKHTFSIAHKIVIGGDTRFHSIKNALLTITDTSGVVAVHDGVRPLVSRETINNCFNKAISDKTAIPVVDLFDSARIINGTDSKTFDRNKIKLVQTPQVFQTEILIEAYDTNFSKKFTDDASVVEKAGYKINLVNGNRTNIKITTPDDLMYAEAIFRNNKL